VSDSPEPSLRLGSDLAIVGSGGGHRHLESIGSMAKPTINRSLNRQRGNSALLPTSGAVRRSCGSACGPSASASESG
jgi:hypothetical protein